MPGIHCPHCGCHDTVCRRTTREGGNVVRQRFCAKCGRQTDSIETPIPGTTRQVKPPKKAGGGALEEALKKAK